MIVSVPAIVPSVSLSGTPVVDAVRAIVPSLSGIVIALSASSDPCQLNATVYAPFFRTKASMPYSPPPFVIKVSAVNDPKLTVNASVPLASGNAIARFSVCVPDMVVTNSPDIILNVPDVEMLPPPLVLIPAFAPVVKIEAFAPVVLIPALSPDVLIYALAPLVEIKAFVPVVRIYAFVPLVETTPLDDKLANVNAQVPSLAVALVTALVAMDMPPKRIE